MKFKSKWLGLTVLTNAEPIQFKNGEYETEDKKEIALLKTIADVEVVEAIDENPEIG